MKVSITEKVYYEIATENWTSEFSAALLIHVLPVFIVVNFRRSAE